MLASLHAQLMKHFAELNAERGGGVYALEHGLSEVDLRRALAEVSDPRDLQGGWLPVVAWAAECGFNHKFRDTDFWPEFEAGLPHCTELATMQQVVPALFERFHREYGGVEPPEGPFRKHFSRISWPLFHGVLPVGIGQQLTKVVLRYQDELRRALAHGDRLSEILQELSPPNPSKAYEAFRSTPQLLGLAACALLDEPLESGGWLTEATQQRLAAAVQDAREALNVRDAKSGSGSGMTGRRSNLELGTELTPVERNGRWELLLEIVGHESLWRPRVPEWQLRSVRLTLGALDLGSALDVFRRGAFLPETLPEHWMLGLKGSGSSELSEAFRPLAEALGDLALPRSRRYWVIDDTVPQRRRAMPAQHPEPGRPALAWTTRPPGAHWRPVRSLHLYETAVATEFDVAQKTDTTSRIWVVGMPPARHQFGGVLTLSDRDTVLGVTPPPGRTTWLQLLDGSGRPCRPREELPTGVTSFVSVEGRLEPGTYWVELLDAGGRRVTPRVVLQAVAPAPLVPTALHVLADVSDGFTLPELRKQGLKGLQVQSHHPVELQLTLSCVEPAEGLPKPEPASVRKLCGAGTTSLMEALQELLSSPPARDLCEDSKGARLEVRWADSVLFRTEHNQPEIAALVERSGHVQPRLYAPNLRARMRTPEQPWKAIDVPDQGVFLAADGTCVEVVAQGKPICWRLLGSAAPELTTFPSSSHLPTPEEAMRACRAWRRVERKTRTSTTAQQRRCLAAAAIRVLGPEWGAAELTPRTSLERELMRLLRLQRSRQIPLGLVASNAAQKLLSAIRKVCLSLPTAPTSKAPLDDWLKWSTALSDVLQRSCSGAGVQIDPRALRAGLWCLVLRPLLSSEFASGQASSEARGRFQFLVDLLDLKPNQRAERSPSLLGVAVARALSLTALEDNIRAGTQRLHPATTLGGNGATRAR